MVPSPPAGGDKDNLTTLSRGITCDIRGRVLVEQRAGFERMVRGRQHPPALAQGTTVAGGGERDRILAPSRVGRRAAVLESRR